MIGKMRRSSWNVEREEQVIMVETDDIEKNTGFLNSSCYDTCNIT